MTGTINWAWIIVLVMMWAVWFYAEVKRDVRENDDWSDDDDSG